MITFLIGFLAVLIIAGCIAGITWFVIKYQNLSFWLFMIILALGTAEMAGLMIVKHIL